MFWLPEPSYIGHELCGGTYVWGPKLLIKFVLEIVATWIRNTAFYTTFTKVEDFPNIFNVDLLGRKFPVTSTSTINFLHPNIHN